MKRVLLIDNFDSFVYNIYQYLEELGASVDVVRNNQVKTVNEYDLIVISPGPGNPENERDFGNCEQIIKNAKVPLLGVCLGHQGIICAFGGKIVRAKKPMHGKMSLINHDSQGIFSEIKNPLKVMRYHSLVAQAQSIPDCLEITAKTEDGEIMGIQHKELPIFGIQFHPESILSEEGKKILKNFLEIGEKK
jgi:anthranilate synthase/aminodeoxychorismate synthase-like glutamine amidotransferase